MPNIVQTPQDEVAWDRAKDIVAKQYGDGLKKSNPERFYALTTAIFKQVRRGLRKYEGHPSDADLIRALLTVKTLVESTYTDYGWTKFLRDADDAMWDKVLAPLRTGLTPWGVTEGGPVKATGELLIQGPLRLLGHLSAQGVDIKYEDAKRLWAADREITEKVADCDYGRLYWHAPTGAAHWNMSDSADWKKGITPPEKCPGNWIKGVLEKHGFSPARVEAEWAPKDPGWHRVDRPLRGPLEVDESYGVATAKSGFEGDVKEPPTAADIAKVDAIVNDPAMPDVADDGKAYVVHWADGRGIFAMKRKADLHPWLKSQGPWAEIISIKHRTPEHGGKPLKVMEGGYLHSHGSYDCELEKFGTHDALIGHMTHIFSGQPHTDKRGATVQITSRAQAHAARDDLTTGDPMATSDARKAADDYFAKRGERSNRLTYLTGPVRDHINAVIDKHFPA